MANWFIFSIASLLLWGVWGFFPKLTTSYINPKSALIFEVAGGIIVAIIVLSLLGFRPETHPRGILFGVLTGIAGLLGALFFLFAVNTGKQLSVVVTMTALYPLIVILLSFVVLNETITLRQGLGIVFAVVAMILFSTG